MAEYVVQSNCSEQCWTRVALNKISPQSSKKPSPMSVADQSNSKSRGQPDGSPASPSSSINEQWTRLRTSVRASGPQACQTALVFLVMLAIVLPMQVSQTIVKNWAAAHMQDPSPDLNPLDRTLPDILLNH